MSHVTSFKIALAVTVAIVLLPAAALLPILPVLHNETGFKASLQELAQDPKTALLKDYEIRRAVQKLARSNNFHIEFEDVFIEYLPKNKIGGDVPLPSKLGYTLHMNLPVFGMLELPVLAVRAFSLQAQTQAKQEARPAELPGENSR